MLRAMLPFARLSFRSLVVAALLVAASVSTVAAQSSATDDWFQKLWRERRSAWAARVAEDQRAVVFLGDSITQGWGGGLAAAFPGSKVANRGISGDTTRGVLLRLREDVLAINPTAVVLLIGTNDLDEGATPEVIAGNLKLIVAGLERHNPSMPIVLCQVFPSSATLKRPADQIKAVNALYLAAV
jgi:lysophospholipase L1-like esterase